MKKQQREINKAKRTKRNTHSRNTVQPFQKNICTFVKFKYQVFEQKSNGNFKRIGKDYNKGLQIENKIYLENGKYKYVNGTSLKIIYKYPDVPDWASENLITMYNNFKTNN